MVAMVIAMVMAMMAMMKYIKYILVVRYIKYYSPSSKLLDFLYILIIIYMNISVYYRRKILAFKASSKMSLEDYLKIQAILNNLRTKRIKRMKDQQYNNSNPVSPVGCDEAVSFLSKSTTSSSSTRMSNPSIDLRTQFLKLIADTWATVSPVPIESFNLKGDIGTGVNKIPFMQRSAMDLFCKHLCRFMNGSPNIRPIPRPTIVRDDDDDDEDNEGEDIEYLNLINVEGTYVHT
jgi:hypothetical protein